MLMLERGGRGGERIPEERFTVTKVGRTATPLASSGDKSNLTFAREQAAISPSFLFLLPCVVVLWHRGKVVEVSMYLQGVHL